MFRKQRTAVLVVALATLAVLLWAPSAGFAAPGSNELLAPGAGYASPAGSEPVRDAQRLLRRLGDEPGPIDGLYGPLTASAVQRFQAAHALATDGVIGPQTMGRLSAERTKLSKAKLRKTRLERKSPDRTNRAESVPEQPPARSVPNGQPDRTKSDSSSGPSPQLAAVVGGLALVLLLVVLWRLARRHWDRPPGQAASGPRLGLVCAALLAAYAIGAATGAVFATHATPDRAAKPSTATAEPGPR